MAVLTPEQRSKLRADTLGACAPFLEDITYLRDLLSSDKRNPGEIRRLSAILRRLLVERAIPIIGASRSGKIKIPEPDNKPIYKSAEKQPFEFFLSAGASAFGANIRSLAMTKGAYRTAPIVDFNPERTVDVPVDNFLDQRVLCLKGQWVSRRDAIKYMANVASGVHAGAPKTPEDELVRRIRQCVTIKPGVKDGRMSADIVMDLDAISGQDKPVVYDASAIDPVLLEVLTAAHFVVLSRDVLNLETIVAQELGQAAPKP